VPLLLSGARITPDRAGRFTEASASRGALGHLRGVDVLPLLVSRR
jgi:2,3-bisphosphoglycerate-independent phosphoglycerate mutase